MASLNCRRQMLIAGLFEGYVDMVHEQAALSVDFSRKEFAAIRDRLKPVFVETMQVLKHEPGGGLNNREFQRIGTAIEQIKANTFNGGLFSPEQAFSFVLCLLDDQLVKVRPATPKHAVFSKLYYLSAEIVDLIDPERKYQDDDGMLAAEFFETVEL